MVACAGPGRSRCTRRGGSRAVARPNPTMWTTPTDVWPDGNGRLRPIEAPSPTAVAVRPRAQLLLPGVILRIYPDSGLALLVVAACSSGPKDGGGGDTSVTGDTGVEDTGAPCSPPVASAGADLAGTPGEPVSLDGSDSTVCSATAGSETYTWSFSSVPWQSEVDTDSLSINGTNAAVSVNFTPDEVGDYVLALIVSDANGDSAEDYIVVTVTRPDEPPSRLFRTGG